MEKGDNEKNNWEIDDQFREDSTDIHLNNWGIYDQFKEDRTEIHLQTENNENNSTVTFGEDGGKDDDDDDFAAESKINNNNGIIKEYRNTVNYQNKKTPHHHRSRASREPKNYMKHTESSIRKTKSWNESVQDNNVKIFSDFRTKPGIIRGSRYAANDQKTQRGRVERKYKGRTDHSSCKKQHDKRKTQQQDSDDDESIDPPSPTYYISRDGSVKTWESFTQKCGACLEEFCSPFVGTEEDQYYDYQEQYRLPDVAVFPCGHLFHCECLDNLEESSDPPCILCLKEV